MRARQIEVFRMVMRCGTLTSAAEALNVSQPALSQILLHTEDELGFKLFQRVKGRLIPTPEAEDLYPEVERLFGDLEALRGRAHDLRHGKAGIVRLAASAPPSLSVVPEALRHFRSAHPALRVLSYVVPAEIIMRMLDDGQAGLGVAMTDEPMAGIDTEIIGRTRMVCVLPAGHELAEKASIAAADLQDETLISYRATSLQGRLLREAFGREGLVFQPEMEIDVSIIGLAFVQQGLGVAVVDGLLPWHSFPGLVTRPFLPEVSLPLCLLTSARRPLSRSHDLLRAHLRTACRELGLAAADIDHKPAL
ncbi:MAG: LysR family transcriptional regulator [Bosea sp. (in: a-proteobacteria)]|uniref:LysR family transcriptional regulator n=1 Tax=Bosea sp. (in: a-proteobacteria) TaxID=1871050 RepID=UPI00273327BF|nr:LysR family transcriptional regulator [Bosea sp. (in: a-proteobacteria)]MDP3601626.1 LysR family transcriptional regulator [Bosea sp. (in: a-proteobacteria)]